MKLQADLDLDDYLAACEVIDVNHPDVQRQAEELKQGSALLTAKACFEWVRDHIRHSKDFDETQLYCNASGVLASGTGYCFAKAHLLVALLRANGLPSGLCYQRLSLKGDGEPYSLHGLAAVYLEGFGWYRIDPRGNKPGVDAQFVPPVEQLAFAINDPQECDFPEVHVRPLPSVVDALSSDLTVSQLYSCLPDAQPTI